MRWSTLCAALAAPILSSGCATALVNEAFREHSRVHVSPTAGSVAHRGSAPSEQRQPRSLKRAVRTSEGVYHVLVAYDSGVERHFFYDPRHPALAQGRLQGWPSADYFGSSSERTTPTMTPWAGDLPPGVPIAIDASGSPGEGLDADELGGGPALQLTYDIVTLREWGEPQRLARIPVLPFTGSRRQSVVYRPRSQAGFFMGKIGALSAAGLVDLALLPLSLLTYAVMR